MLEQHDHLILPDVTYAESGDTDCYCGSRDYGGLRFGAIFGGCL